MYSDLEKKAKEIRRGVLDITYSEREGHIGGSYSIIETLVALYYNVMEKEDRFILSKGHAWLPQYCILKDKGFNPPLYGHPELDIENGVYCTTGSLGHGFPSGLGRALAKKVKKEKGDIYVLISDAECQEGTTWESALVGAHHKLDNFVLIVDNNKLQILGKTDDILRVEDLEKKFKAFEWEASRINGHSFEQLIYYLKERKTDKPRVIIADTIKGKGVSYMENTTKWHKKIPNEEELKQAYKELE